MIFMFRNKIILITGGTGSLGSTLTKYLLKTDVKTIRIFSRDELKQTDMRSKIMDKRLRFFIGDIRDKERLSRAMEDVDIVFHTAALKQVPVAEYNPFEFVKTNIQGSQNVIDTCLENNIELAVAVGTDKAVSPVNTYGATKLLMEKLFISANYYTGKHKTKFICVRYGNVLGSRGSILPLIIKKIKTKQQIPITDASMTRFNITMKEAIKLILRAVQEGKGGEIFIPKLKAYRVGDLKNAVVQIVDKKSSTKKIPVRPGEKFHESLISKDEMNYVFESKKDYIVYNLVEDIISKKHNYKKINLKKEYSSDNADLLTVDQIKEIIKKDNLIDNII